MNILCAEDLKKVDEHIYQSEDGRYWVELPGSSEEHPDLVDLEGPYGTFEEAAKAEDDCWTIDGVWPNN